MPIDEVRFGELIGTVNQLVISVADLKGAVIPALTKQRDEMARYVETARKDMEDHKKTDTETRDALEEKDRVMWEAMAGILEWVRGDGTEDNPGAKKQLNTLVSGKSKLVAMVSGFAIAAGLLSHKLSDKMGDLLKLFGV